MILKKDLVEDKYYIFHYKNDYLVKYSKIPFHINLRNPDFVRNGSFRLHDIEEDSSNNCYCVREATPLEIAHLEACIKANKYVELKDVQFNNEIILW